MKGRTSGDWGTLLLWTAICVLIGFLLWAVFGQASEASARPQVWGCWSEEKSAWAVDPSVTPGEGERVFAVATWGQAQTMCDYLNEGTGVYVPALMNAGRPLMVAAQEGRGRR